MNIVKTTPTPGEQFSAKRHKLSRTGLGGSDAAAVLGLNKYRTPLDVWMACTGRLEAEPQSEPAEWGTRLEPVVLQKYAEGLSYPEVLIGRDAGGRVAQFGDGGGPLDVGDPVFRAIRFLFGTLRHPDLPHLLMHLDALVVNCETCEVLRLVESKTAGYWPAKDWGEPGTDEAPEPYIIQAHDYAGILALNGHPVPVCDVPVLIAGQRYAVYPIDISVTLYRRVHERLDEWWNAYVVADQMPPVSGADNARLSDLYPEDDGELVPAPEELADWARALGEYRDMAKEAADGRTECEAHIKAEVGENAGLEAPEWKVTWKKAKDSEATDWQAAFADLRASIGLHQDKGLLTAADEAVAAHTETKPGSRRLLTYGIAKTAKGDE